MGRSKENERLGRPEVNQGYRNKREYEEGDEEEGEEEDEDVEERNDRKT